MPRAPTGALSSALSSAVQYLLVAVGPLPGALGTSNTKDFSLKKKNRTAGKMKRNKDSQQIFSKSLILIIT